MEQILINLVAERLVEWVQVSHRRRLISVQLAT
jgi:hypothetical protein